MARKTIEDRMNRGEDLTDRMALDARFDLAEKIGPAARNDPTVNQCLALIGMGQQTPIDGLCLAIRTLSGFNDKLISISAQPVNGRIEMVFKDSDFYNEMVDKEASQAERIAYLESRVMDLKEEVRKARQR